MNLGPKLVTMGTIIGAASLFAFLSWLTTGTAYPQIALANEIDKPSPSGLEIELKLSSDSQPEVEDSSSISDDCAVSNKFPSSVRQWCGLITRYAEKRGLSPDLVAAIIWIESGGDSQAYSHSGAVGLMQVMPSDGIASSFMCVNGPCFSNRPTTAQLNDPEYNISYGTKYLAGLLARSGSVREALKSYGPMDMGYAYADRVLNLYQQYGQVAQ
ncbi:MAG: transglycosylase SLT domain-containing protein [Anaerolineales bacterium]|nr:transglycosylase SLT domain-containing protein [Anaerolineales bacterium]